MGMEVWEYGDMEYGSIGISVSSGIETLPPTSSLGPAEEAGGGVSHGGREDEDRL